MGKARSRNHIGGTGADGAGGDHNLAAQFSLSIINGDQRHGLLILPPPYGKWSSTRSKASDKLVKCPCLKYQKDFQTTELFAHRFQ